MLNYPDAHVATGDTFRIVPPSSRTEAGLATTAPGGKLLAGVADFRADGRLVCRSRHIRRSVDFSRSTAGRTRTAARWISICVWDFRYGRPASKSWCFFRNGRVRLFDQVDRTAFPQVVPPAAAPAGNTLSGGANFLSVDFSNNALVKLAGLPRSAGRDFFSGASFEEATFAYSFHLLDLYINTQFSLKQDFVRTEAAGIPATFPPVPGHCLSR